MIYCREYHLEEANFSLGTVLSLSRIPSSKQAAIAYTKPWFHGDKLVLKDAQTYEWHFLSERGFDDRIRSIKLSPGFSARLCSDPYQGGVCKDFTLLWGADLHIGDGVSSIVISKKKWFW